MLAVFSRTLGLSAIALTGALSVASADQELTTASVEQSITSTGHQEAGLGMKPEPAVDCAAATWPNIPAACLDGETASHGDVRIIR